MLGEEMERSAFDEQRVVNFEEDVSPHYQQRGKPTKAHPEPPMGVAVDGSLGHYSHKSVIPLGPMKASRKAEPESPPVHWSMKPEQPRQYTPYEIHEFKRSLSQ